MPLEKATDTEESGELTPITLPSEEASDYPDGGWRAWTALAGAWCTLFCSFGLVNSIGVFQDYYTREPLRQYSPSTIAWIMSIEVWTQNFVGILSGYLYDIYGPTWLMVGGTVLFVFGLMMTSLSSEYYQFFLAQSIVASIGSSASFTASMSSLATWFYRRRSLVFGLMMSGSSVSGVVLPLMISQLLRRIGFPWTMRVLGFFALGLLTFSCLTVRSRLSPNRRPIALKRYFDGLRDPTMALTILSMFLFFWGMFVPFNFILVQAKSLGMDPHLADYILPTMNAAGFLGRIIPTMAADRFGRINMTIATAFLTAVFCLALWIPGESDASIFVFAVLFGFSSGGYVSLAPAIVAQISPIKEIGIRTGSAFAWSSFGSLTGLPLAGAITSASNGSYLGLQLFCGLTSLASAFSLVSVRYLQVGWKFTKV
ncbi:MFS general substrate transporter [Thozetella sp. PMI_491]|nr:MFS general substrate transporter [Thozetella sp. PMI_491]